MLCNPFFSSCRDTGVAFIRSLNHVIACLSISSLYHSLINHFFYYFDTFCRALLYGGMKESQPGTTEIELQDTPSIAFAALLKYIYTGRMNLVEIQVRYISGNTGNELKDWFHAIWYIGGMVMDAYWEYGKRENIGDMVKGEILGK